MRVLVLVSTQGMQAARAAQPLQRVLMLVFHILRLVVLVAISLGIVAVAMPVMRVMQVAFALALDFTLVGPGWPSVRGRQAADVAAEAACPEVTRCRRGADALRLPIASCVTLLPIIR